MLSPLSSLPSPPAFSNRPCFPKPNHYQKPHHRHTITIPKIEWVGFKSEKSVPLELGNFEADSDHLIIKTSNPRATDYQKRVEITLMPKLDPRILKPIRIDAYLGEKDNKAI